MSEPPYTPYPVAGPPAPSAKAPPPPSIVRATTLMFVQVALSLVSLVVTLATIGSVRTRMESRNSTLTKSQLDLVVNVSIAAAIVFGLASAGLFLFLAFKLRAGRRWAWIVTLVLTILAVASLSVSLGQNTPGASRALSALAGVLDIVLLVLILQKPSRDYVNRPRFPGY